MSPGLARGALLRLVRRAIWKARHRADASPRGVGALSAGGRNRLGPVRLIEVPGAHRIRAQRTLFLDTSHPELVEQYVAFSRWFKCGFRGQVFV